MDVPLGLPAVIVPVEVGMEMVVEGVVDVPKIIPEEVAWPAVAAEALATVTVVCVEPADTVLGVLTGTVAPELLAVLGLAACGVGCPAGTSVALLSGRAIDMRESSRSNFSVSKELLRMTG